MCVCACVVGAYLLACNVHTCLSFMFQCIYEAKQCTFIKYILIFSFLSFTTLDFVICSLFLIILILSLCKASCNFSSKKSYINTFFSIISYHMCRYMCAHVKNSILLWTVERVSSVWFLFLFFLHTYTYCILIHTHIQISV